MYNERQYDTRDIMELDKEGGYYSRHISAMTGEELHDKSDIAAELAYRDYMIDKLQAKVDLRDSMIADKNRRYQTVRVDRNRIQRERDIAYSALHDIVSPLPRMERIAASEGNVLSSQAAEIANDVSYLRSIATSVLEGHPNGVLRLLISQIKGKEIKDILESIGKETDRASFISLLHERLNEAHNTPAFSDSSDLETLLESISIEERTAVVGEIYKMAVLRSKTCKYITLKHLRQILKDIVPTFSSK